MGDDGFYKRSPKGAWYCRTDPLTGKQVSTGCFTVAHRELWYEDRVRQKLDPTYKPKTASGGLNFWCVKVVTRKLQLKSAATADFYKKKLGHIVRILGNEIHGDEEVGLDLAFAPDNWDTYVEKRLAEKARPTTIKKEIGCAKVVAKAAKRKGAFSGDVSLFRPDDLEDDYKPGTRFLTPEEMPRLLDKLRSPFHRAHVAAAVAFAARYSEAFRVQPEDVDIDSWTVHIPGTKTDGADARIPIAEPFRPYLLMALPFLPLRPWHNGSENLVLKRACIKAKIEKITTNDLRRTHASWLTEAGVPDSITSRVMRHVDERMVRTIYGRSRPEKLCAALDKFFNVKVAELVNSPDNYEQTEAVEEKPKTSNELPRVNKTGFRGVYAQRRGKPFRAAIASGELMPCGKRRREVALGTFDDAVSAAKAYDAAALLAFGPGAVLNFPVTKACHENQADSISSLKSA